MRGNNSEGVEVYLERIYEYQRLMEKINRGSHLWWIEAEKNCGGLDLCVWNRICYESYN